MRRETNSTGERKSQLHQPQHSAELQASKQLQCCVSDMHPPASNAPQGCLHTALPSWHPTPEAELINSTKGWPLCWGMQFNLSVPEKAKSICYQLSPTFFPYLLFAVENGSCRHSGDQVFWELVPLTMWSAKSSFSSCFSLHPKTTIRLTWRHTY